MYIIYIYIYTLYGIQDPGPCIHVTVYTDPYPVPHGSNRGFCHKSQKLWLSKTVEKYPGCQLKFHPKFHCEFNFIEMVWTWAKVHHRSTCTYKYNDLKTGLPVTFDCSLIPYYMYMYSMYIYIHVVRHTGPWTLYTRNRIYRSVSCTTRNYKHCLPLVVIIAT